MSSFIIRYKDKVHPNHAFMYECDADDAIGAIRKLQSDYDEELQVIYLRDKSFPNSIFGTIV